MIISGEVYLVTGYLPGQKLPDRYVMLWEDKNITKQLGYRNIRRELLIQMIDRTRNMLAKYYVVR